MHILSKAAVKSRNIARRKCLIFCALRVSDSSLVKLSSHECRELIKVRYEGHVTETVETLNGCPQGSVLSPIIFSLLMNSL